MGRPMAELTLTDEERTSLVRWSRRAKSSQALAQRCRIVRGRKDEQAGRLRPGDLAQTVGKWRRRFLERRLEGLVDKPRPGAPRKITNGQVGGVVVATLERTPKDATHRSRASRATESGPSKSTIGRIWRTFGLKPHRVDTFKLSNDPQFIAEVRDVVGLYLDPPEAAPVPCVDEKSQIQALDRSAPGMPHPRPPWQRRHHPVRGLGPPGRSSAHSTAAPGPRRSRSSCSSPTARCPPAWTSTSSAPTTARTRPRRSRNGCRRIPASAGTSPPPTRLGSTGSSGGWPC